MLHSSAPMTAALRAAIMASVVAALVVAAAGCGKPKSELDRARAMASRNANSAPAQLALGRALANAGQYNDAFVALSRARELDAKDAEIAYELARTDLALGNSAHGIPMAKAALEANPKHSRAANILARFYMQMDHPRDALPYLRQSIEADPKNGEAYIDLAAVQLALGDTQSALLTSRQSVRVASGNASAHFLLAELLDKTGDPAGAERELRQSVQLDPKAAGARLRLGARLISNPKTVEEARSLALEAKAINPGDGAAAGLAAEALMRLGKSKEALQEFSVACQSNPYNFRLWLLFARHLREQGLTEEADRAMKYAMQVAPRAPYTPTQRKALNNKVRATRKGQEVLPGSIEDMLANPDSAASGASPASGAGSGGARVLGKKGR